MLDWLFSDLDELIDFKYDKEKKRMKFKVIDRNTGEYPDVQNIALTEDWARRLIYCDIDGFYVSEDGSLVLVDDCNNIAFCPSDRFEVIWESEVERDG